jgi:hypothetical protein
MKKAIIKKNSSFRGRPIAPISEDSVSNSGESAKEIDIEGRAKQTSPVLAQLASLAGRK